MKRQVEMEEAMLLAHRDFMNNLEKATTILEKEINEAKEMTHICTDEWCKATENYLDELYKDIFSISEPRCSTKEDSDKIKVLRRKVKDLYVTYKASKK